MEPADLGAALGLGPSDQSENICSFEIYPQALGKLVPTIIGMISFL